MRRCAQPKRNCAAPDGRSFPTSPSAPANNRTANCFNRIRTSFASASVDLPLWNRNQGSIASAQAAVEQAQAEAARVRLALRHTAAPLIEQYNIAAAQSARYKSDLLPRAQRAYELYRGRYRELAAAYPQVLVSQRTLFQLQLTYIQSLGELWQSSAQLRHFTLSGGLAANSDR
jgi:cobalt-zinc-cadmium efflux system outer membrane protein